MVEFKKYTGTLNGPEMKHDKRGLPFICFLLDDWPFRYFKGDLDHKEQTLVTLRQRMNGPLSVVYTERTVEGMNYPFRTVNEFKGIDGPPAKQEGGPREEPGPVKHEKPAAPEDVIPFTDEEIISDLTQDPEVMLLRKCIRLAVVAWYPQMKEWEGDGLKPSADFTMTRIGETATSFYISKKQERR